MKKIQENICKQACSYVFVQENYIKAHVLMYFLQLVLTFTPPLHHNGKGSIEELQANSSLASSLLFQGKSHRFLFILPISRNETPFHVCLYYVLASFPGHTPLHFFVGRGVAWERG